MLAADLLAWPALVAFVLALAGTVILLARGLGDRWTSWGTRMAVRASVLVLSVCAFLLLAAAAANPRWETVPPKPSLHIVLALDISNSVLRGPGGWKAVQEMVLQRIAQTQEALENPAGAHSMDLSTSLVTFAGGSESRDTGDLPGFGQALRQLTPALGGAASNVALGLDRSREAVAANGGQGVVILVSDGHATEGDALAAARRLGADGIPLYVWPVSGSGPSTAIAAAYVAKTVDAGAEIQARLILANGDQPSGSEVIVHVNPGLVAEQRFGPAATMTHTMTLDPQQRASVRVPLSFLGGGMQLVEAGLQTQKELQEQRRFYVQVKQPPRILAVGDSQWAAALPKSVAEVTTSTAADFRGAADLKGYDAMVISGVPATEFQPAALAELASAVTEAGLGLFMVNGAHTGQAEDTPTVLMSYNGSPIEPLLPISTRPRPALKEPPPLHIVILIDTSGSMADGYKLEMAKAIARQLIDAQMRPADRLDLLTFTSEAQHLVVDSEMNGANKRAALAAVDGLQAGGGTVIGPALDEIAGRSLGECGLIIISDLEFDVAKQRPECKSTIFAVGADPAYGSPLEAFAEPVFVGPDFSPANIKLSIYNPEPRDKFFEPGQYQALSAEHQGRAASHLPVPSLPLDGDAISYLVEDAQLVAVRPRVTDPVLAYKRSGSGYVGAFTTGFPAEWLGGTESRQAIRAWIERILPFVAQNRYNIRLEYAGDRLLVRVELTGEDGRIPEITRLSAAAEYAGGAVMNAGMVSAPDAAGAFTGEFMLPRQTGSGLGFLVITEEGPEALPRPQRVPFAVPPQGAAGKALTQEDYSFGTDSAALATLVAAGTGSVADAGPLPLVVPSRAPERTTPLWPGLLVAGLASLIAAVALPRWFP